MQSFGSAVVPAPFKKRVKAGVATGQEAQEVRLVQVGQPGPVVGAAVQSAHLPFVPTKKPVAQVWHLSASAQVTQFA